jgi:hypothetical protein
MASQFDELSGQCAVCGKPVSQGDGLVRREHGDETVALCCPSCVAAFARMPTDMSGDKRPKGKCIRFINCCGPRRRHPQMNPRDLHKIEIAWQQSGWSVPVRQGGRTVLNRSDFARGGSARLSLQGGSPVAAFHKASVCRAAPVGQPIGSPAGRTRPWHLLPPLVLASHGSGQPSSALFLRFLVRGCHIGTCSQSAMAVANAKILSANSTHKRKE